MSQPKSLKQAVLSSVLVQDGALGTQLELLIPLDDPHSVKGLPLWSTNALIHAPQLITQIHASYLAVGADMLITATYQALLQTLAKYGGMDTDQSRAIWQRAVDCAQQARADAGSGAFVAGSVGPYGAFLANGAEYSGDYGDISRLQLKDYHREIVRFYVESAVDVIAFETIANMREVEALVELLEDTYTLAHHKEYFMCFSCKDAHHLVDGTPLHQVVQYISARAPSIAKSDLVGIGCNCVPFEIVEGFITGVNRSCEDLGVPPVPLLVYPNLGFELDDTAHYSFRSSTENWARSITAWAQHANVRVIGGCCSTGPAEIAQIRKIVDEMDLVRS